MPGRTDSLKLTLHRHCDNGSLVLPEVETGQPWDRGGVPLDAGKCWHAGKPVPPQRDAHSTGTTHHFRLGNDLEWSRSVRLIHAIPELPIIAIRDTFSGPRAAEPKILTFNLMAAGPVATPAGPMTPPERTHARESFTPGKVEDELPSAGKVFELPPGVHRLGFSGQTWKAHPAGGIDFDVYLSSDTAAQVHIGNWAHLWHPSPEEGQFCSANDAQRFEERQHILRVRGTAAFTTLLVPWNKDRQPAGLHVSADGNSLVVRTANQMIRLDKSTLACSVVRD
jgi:hypothetical protein